MARFTVVVTAKAQSDLYNLRDAIVNYYKAPLTAKRYLEDLNRSMQWLANGADYFPSVPELYYTFGFEVHRLNFKKMAILYSIEDEIVYIHRIIPQNMIIY